MLGPAALKGGHGQGDRHLGRAGTWSTITHPVGKNIIGSKWAFKIKLKSDGTVDEYKARLVAPGRSFTQLYGVNYFDTYSPVAKMASFCVVLAIAMCYDWDIEFFDFNGTYLNGTLNEEPP